MKAKPKRMSAHNVKINSALQQSRLTIGFLTTQLRDRYESELVHHLAEFATELDINLLCFAIGSLPLSENAICNLVSAERMQGLIISPTLVYHYGSESVAELCERYALPVVGGALGIDGVLQVLPDSLRGMRQAVDHLIDVHHYQHIAFIQGPAGQQEAEERYQAYVDALTEHNMPVPSNLVMPGDYVTESGAAAMRKLLDLEVPLDAVVVANDDMAIGAFGVLQARGLQVPEDVALVGFDDIEAARVLPVPLTTVRQPMDAYVECLLTSVLRLIQGEDLPLRVTLPTELVIRRSCGCALPEGYGVFTEESLQRQQIAQRLAYRDLMYHLQSLDRWMGGILELPEIASALDAHLPDLGIEKGYVALYEESQQMATAARLLLSHHEQETQFYADSPKFPLSRILPDSMWAESPPIVQVVMPLALREQQLGYVVLDLGPHEGLVYDQIGSQISGALFRSLLLDQQQAARNASERLLQDAERRATLLAGVAETSRATTSITDLSELLSKSVNLILERFDLYYVGVFLVDENERWAVLHAATGEAGREMLARGHRLEIAPTSLIGTCVSTGAAQIALDVAHEPVSQRRNPLLPHTRSEMALPLISRDHVIGAMTIQSTVPSAFSEDDITILQTMADQLANAIENARLFDQMEQNRRELEIASGRYTQESWQKFMEGAKAALGYRFRLTNVEPAEEMYPEAQTALSENTPVLTKISSEDATEQSALGIPLRLRDEVLGVLNLRFEDETVPSETIDLVEQIAERLAVSLESARLLQETRSAAERERLTGQVTARMRESLEVDAVIRTAAQQILEVMNLSSVTIRLAPRDVQSEGGE